MSDAPPHPPLGTNEHDVAAAEAQAEAAVAIAEVQAESAEAIAETQAETLLDRESEEWRDTVHTLTQSQDELRSGQTELRQTITALGESLASIQARLSEMAEHRPNPPTGEATEAVAHESTEPLPQPPEPEPSPPRKRAHRWI